MSWRRGPNHGLESLPTERKTLAERYTIDADEAARHAQLAAEESARRASEQAAARKVAAEARNGPAEQAQPRTSRQPQRAAVSESSDSALGAEPIEGVVVGGDPTPETGASTLDLPIYRWFGNSQ